MVAHLDRQLTMLLHTGTHHVAIDVGGALSPVVKSEFFVNDAYVELAQKSQVEVPVAKGVETLVEVPNVLMDSSSIKKSNGRKGVVSGRMKKADFLEREIVLTTKLDDIAVTVDFLKNPDHLSDDSL